MDMVLRRLANRQDGIVGELQSDDILSFKCATLEHAYADDRGGWFSKIPIGFYKCVRGMHKLTHGPMFETFEIKYVPGHTGILFHTGNFNNDSMGCVLLGERMEDRPGQAVMIANSKITFELFMRAQRNVKEFNLTVINYPSMVGRS